MKKQLRNYLIYLIALPLIGYAFMYMLRSGTHGAHDGGLLGMVLGLFVVQIICTIWLCKFQWYFSLMFGIGTSILTLFFSFWLVGMLSSIFQPSDSYAYETNKTVDLILEIIFFLVLGISSIFIIELLNKLKSLSE